MKQALIVEKDQLVATELETVLGQLHFEVTTLADPVQAPAALEERQYAIAFVNLKLPNTSWQTTLRTVKQASRSTTVILMTRSADEEDVWPAVRSGAYGVLDRPLTRNQLASLIAPRYDGLFIVLRG